LRIHEFELDFVLVHEYELETKIVIRCWVKQKGTRHRRQPNVVTSICRTSTLRHTEASSTARRHISNKLSFTPPFQIYLQIYLTHNECGLITQVALLQGPAFTRTSLFLSLPPQCFVGATQFWICRRSRAYSAHRYQAKLAQRPLLTQSLTTMVKLTLFPPALSSRFPLFNVPVV